MLDNFIFKSEKNYSFFRVFLGCFILTLIISFFNYFIGGDFLFLVALVSMALVYPVINFILSFNKEELEKQMSCRVLFLRHEREMLVFLSLFFAVTLGFFISSFYFISDFTYQKSFINLISGNFLDFSNSFFLILINNLLVGFFTFLISMLIFSGFVFVLVWNASILAYFMYSLKSSSSIFISFISILPHLLFEIGGFILAGFAGTVVAYKFYRRDKFGHNFDKEFFKDLLILILMSFIFIFLGAVIEIL
jgi:uncharacterized membrane protein SpoIIM required for sporulation